MSYKSFNPSTVKSANLNTVKGLNSTRNKSRAPIITKNTVIARDSGVCVLGVHYTNQDHGQANYR